MTEEQFLALELWVLSAANKAVATGGVFGFLDSYGRRREEAKALLVQPQRNPHDNG